MRKYLVLILLLALLPFSAHAAEFPEEAPTPFTVEDVYQITEGLTVVGDYVMLLSPTNYAWWFEGEATGISYLTLINETEDEILGITTLALYAEEGLIEGAPDGIALSLGEETMAREAWLTDAYWAHADYALPLIRAVGLGAAASDVVAAFHSESPDMPDYGLDALHEDAASARIFRDAFFILGGQRLTDEETGETIYHYGWCSHLEEEESWREYFSLDYIIAEERVQAIILSYSADPE